ncbi:hypothetical protein AAFF_G00001040 [Aldrovandia affinis]|uniref:Uncharacterized protein n=1 Tax=Aldrovandia affinis TaxID=143900 RepID=A0AAD7X378_9TELE|nr:hypothetical protein AAFF_G00001040 [Aldrovandia affinis]
MEGPCWHVDATERFQYSTSAITQNALRLLLSQSGSMGREYNGILEDAAVAWKPMGVVSVVGYPGLESCWIWCIEDPEEYIFSTAFRLLELQMSGLMRQGRVKDGWVNDTVLL